MTLKLSAVAAGTAWLVMAGGVGAQPMGPYDSGVRVDLSQGAPTPYQDPTAVRHDCRIDPFGVVSIDGKPSVWRDDDCGRIPLKAPPRSCQVNKALKLWRLYWTDNFWIYVRVTAKSPTAFGLCPQGMEMDHPGSPDAQPVWSDLPRAGDDAVLMAKR